MTKDSKSVDVEVPEPADGGEWFGEIKAPAGKQNWFGTVAEPKPEAKAESK